MTNQRDKYGRRVGLWEDYAYIQGRRILVKQTNYKDGFRHGFTYDYFHSGGVGHFGRFDMGFRTGPWKYYYGMQKIYSTGFYRKDNEVGLHYKYIYDDNRIKI